MRFSARVRIHTVYTLFRYDNSSRLSMWHTVINFIEIKNLSKPVARVYARTRSYTLLYAFIRYTVRDRNGVKPIRVLS